MANPRLQESVTLWRCPVCGGVDLDTSQTSRYCGRTKRCAVTTPATRTVSMTPMERVRYAPESRNGAFRYRDTARKGQR